MCWYGTCARSTLPRTHWSKQRTRRIPSCLLPPDEYSLSPRLQREHWMAWFHRYKYLCHLSLRTWNRVFLFFATSYLIYHILWRGRTYRKAITTHKLLLYKILPWYFHFVFGMYDGFYKWCNKLGFKIVFVILFLVRLLVISIVVNRQIIFFRRVDIAGKS